MFDQKEAVSISNTSVCVASLIRYFVLAFKPNPKKKGKERLINYNLVLLSVPCVIFGS